ncbi:MAG: LEA type 2 family protein [Cytophagales bacterium]|nr:LEA type 2 family protein [Cytophagales bacterium]
MKTVVWVLLVVAVAVVGYLGVSWALRSEEDPQATFVKPRLEIGNFQITSLEKEQTKGNLIVLVDNPAPVGFRADSLAYTVYIAGEEVMRSLYPKPVELEATDSSTVRLPVTVQNEKLIRTLKLLEKKGVDSADYTIKTQVYANLPLLEGKPLDFEITKKLPVFRLPEVKIVSADLDKLGLNQTKFTVKAEITNENNFPYVFRDTHYRMTLNGEEFTEGSLPETVNIPAMGKATVELPVEVKAKEAFKTGFRLLDKDKKNTYEFVFQAKIVDREGDKSFQDSQIKLQSQGDLRELLKEAKEVVKK